MTTASTASATIETSKAAGRRELNFTTLDEAIADANRLAAAEREGRLHRLGNWSFGQNLGHLAAWVNYSFDGLPMTVPWFVRLPMRFFKNKVLNSKMRPGSRIPGISGGTLGIEPLSSEEGLERFNKAFSRLKAGSPALPHALFGRLTHEEWIKQHLRHAELHLSFMRAGE